MAELSDLVVELKQVNKNLTNPIQSSGDKESAAEKSRADAELKGIFTGILDTLKGGMGKAAEKNIQKLDKFISSTSMFGIFGALPPITLSKTDPSKPNCVKDGINFFKYGAVEGDPIQPIVKFLLALKGECSFL